MHPVVMENLEDYLVDALHPAVLREFEAHLKACGACQEVVREMQEVRSLFDSLRTEEALTPSPGFYNRVMRQVEASRRTPTFAGLFALDFAFGRRLVFASLLTLAVLGSYLVSREVDYAPGPTPEYVMAQDSDAAPAARDRDKSDRSHVVL